MHRLMHRIVLATAIAVVFAPASGGAAVDRAAMPEQPSVAWDVLRPSLFGERAILDGGGMIALDAPYRAEDAGIVPIGIAIDPGPDRRVRRVSLIIDENPVPMAAEFELGESMGRKIDLSVRVRIDAYSNVRVVAELGDGTLYQHARFVKASGGCSAPALKDQDATMASLGEMRLRRFTAAADADDRRPEAQVMVRHPNSSGFQMDPTTNLYVPAHFVDELAVTQKGQLLFRMTGGISISEDPTVRFRYVPTGDDTFEVTATDTERREFRASFPAGEPN